MSTPCSMMTSRSAARRCGGCAAQCATNAAFRATSLTCYGGAWVAGNGATNSVWVDNAGNKVRPTNRLNATGYGVTVAWETPIGVLKSTNSWRAFDSQFFNDNDYTPYILLSNNNDIYDQDQLSHELQLVGDAFDGRLNYAVGLYYFREAGREDVTNLQPSRSEEHTSE